MTKQVDQLEIHNFKFHNAQVFTDANGNFHKSGGPAVLADEGVAWYSHGRLHRFDYPAVEKTDGTTMFFYDGKLHRGNGPAVSYPNGDQEYWEHGKFIKQIRKPVSYHETKAKIPEVLPENVVILGRMKAHFKDASKSVVHREDGPAIEIPGSRNQWVQNGLLHREGGPALEFANGDFIWANQGKVHREGGPASFLDGTETWYLNGLIHRDNGEPAIISPMGKCWMEFNKLHREGGPAMDTPNLKIWARRGEYHREDGAAVEQSDGSKEWWANGRRHRLDGPAVMGKTTEYWVDGVQKTEAEFKQLTKKPLLNKTGTEVLTRVAVGQLTKTLQDKVYPKGLDGKAGNFINWMLGVTLMQSSDHPVIQKVAKEMRVGATENYFTGIVDELSKMMKDVKVTELLLPAAEPVETKVEEEELLEMIHEPILRSV